MKNLRSRVAPFLIAVAPVLACGGDGNAPLKQWDDKAVTQGLISGRVVDVETGQPIANAQVLVGGAQRARTTADGQFEVTAPAGRARVQVQTQEHVVFSREVVIGGATVPTSFKLARKAPAQRVGRQGGLVAAKEASLEVPAGALASEANISVTFNGRTRIAASPAPAQFIDDNQVPRRVLALVAIDTSVALDAPARMRVPVTEDASVESVAVYRVNEQGEWAEPINVDGVAAGIATFPVRSNGVFGVTVDVRRADQGRTGYVVLDRGDAKVTEGDVLAGGTEIETATRALVVVDPQGSTIEVAPASRALLEAPAQMPSDPMRAPSAATSQTDPPVVPFGARVRTRVGTVKFLVAKKKILAAEGIRLEVVGSSARFEAVGTAFSVTSCDGAGRDVDVLEVVEGTVRVRRDTQPATNVSAGRTTTLCRGCSGSAVPSCTSAAPDASAAPPVTPDAAVSATPGLDAGVPSTPDASGGVLVVDGPAAADAGDDAAADVADATALPQPSIDVAGTPPGADAGMTAPPDASAPPPPVDAAPAASEDGGALPPPPDMDIVLPDAAAKADMSVVVAPDMDPGVPDVFVPPDAQVAPAPDAFVLPDAPAPPDADGAVITPVDAMVAIPPDGPSDGPDAPVDMGTAMLYINPPAHSFGAVNVGSASAPVTFTVANTGSSPIVNMMAFLTGANATDFATPFSSCTGTLAPSAMCQVDVEFRPSVGGDRFATLTVGSGATYTMAALSGTGSVATVSLTIAPDMHDYMGGPVGAVSADVTFTITNAGGGMIPAPMVMLKGPYPGDYEIGSSGCNVPLPPSGSCDVAVRFKPMATGPRNADLEASAMGGPPVLARLYGSGLQQPVMMLMMTPMNMDFGTQPVGQPGNPVPFTVTNGADTATGPLTTTLSGQGFQVVGDGCTGAVLAKGQTCTVQVQAVAVVQGPQAGNLQVSGMPGGTASAGLMVSGASGGADGAGGTGGTGGSDAGGLDAAATLDAL